MLRTGFRIEVVVDVEDGQDEHEALAEFLATTDISQGWEKVWQYAEKDPQ